MITLVEIPTLATRIHDSARYLESEEMIAEYLLAASVGGDAREIAHALGVVARARGMTDLARKVGMSRAALYTALSGEGNPELATVTKVADALGYRLSLVAKDEDGVAAEQLEPSEPPSIDNGKFRPCQG